MKKLLLPVLVLIVMLASVSPAFAKGGKPPLNPGKGALKQAVTPAPKENGKPDKNVEKPNGKNKGIGAQNFVLFGTLKTVTLPDSKPDDTVVPSELTGQGTITVTIMSGNNVVRGLTGDVTIIVPDGAKIKWFDGEQADWGTLAELESAAGTGETVRVHGWYIPEQETPPTTEVTTEGTEESATEITGTWTARQVYLMLDFVPEPTGTGTAEPSGD